jgi:glucose/arabinose dehydrogenase/mono/diheme cytochrome c family protein
MFRLLASMSTRSISLIFLILAASGMAADAGDPNEEQVRRGKLLYLQNCVICHQSSGQGSPEIFPPLAKSDFLMSDKKTSILALVQGLSGRIVVNGKTYNGAMPPSVLDDQKVADVLTYVRNSFGNSGEAITAEEVQAVRSKSRFSTYNALVDANKYLPLPKPPDGFTLREVVRLPDHGTRLASDGKGKALYVLADDGDVWRVDIAKGQPMQLLRGRDYVDRKRGHPSVVGLTLDKENRFYIVVDQRNESGAIVTNDVTIFRTAASKGEPAEPKPWLQVSYPWGIGPFNHGVGHIALGPDGFVYVSSGSRTDGNEPGTDKRFYQGGEVPLTACIWRLDPKAEKPEIDIFARGLRNTYGFCWDEKGQMFATDNGPDADAPEELNRIEKGKHYGFPYQFADWSKKPYPHTPDAPAGVEFMHPIANLGPDGGDNAKPIYTFDPHSSPAGIVYLGADFPEKHRGTFLVTRFGNLIKTPKDVGYDLLQIRLKDDKAAAAAITTFLAPLGRPLDVHLAGKGKIYILEYSRQANNNPDLPMLPGRILELAVKR